MTSDNTSPSRLAQDEVKSVMDVLKIMEQFMICVNCGPPAILIILIIQYIATRSGKTDKAWQPPTFWGLLGIYIWKIGLPIIRECQVPGPQH